MKKYDYHTSFLSIPRLLVLLLLALLSTLGGASPALAHPVGGLVDYCFTTADYAVLAETVGPNVNFTFHPLGATAGGSLAILYLREGPTGAYPGYTMAKNAAGDFTFSKAIAGGTVTSVYFTYEIGPGGAQQTSLTNPHTYTVGTSCRTPTATATQPAALAMALSIAPNPALGRAVVSFTAVQTSAFVAAIYDLKGAQVKTIGAGTAEAGKLLALPLSTEELANGMYLVKLQTDTGVATARLVVSR